MQRHISSSLRSRQCRCVVLALILVLVFIQWKALFISQKQNDGIPHDVDGQSFASALKSAKAQRLNEALLQQAYLAQRSKGNSSSASIEQGSQRLNSSKHEKVKSLPTARVKDQYYRREPVRLITDLYETACKRSKTSEYWSKMTNNVRMDRLYANDGPHKKDDDVVTVVLMPHSHNDPGWLWTFDMYQQEDTDNIFKNLVRFLDTVDDKMPFQWSESVSLLRWYRSASEASRNTIKKAIQNGNVVMDHGSWSMPDEASTNVYSLVENLILGHTWLSNEFDISPEFSWSNDPFGHSSTIPYLLKQSGIRGMVINRIDMLLKKDMREKQMLEFYWRQAGDVKADDNSNDIFTHLLPYDLYSTSRGFGPNLNLARLYDFSPTESRYTPLVDLFDGRSLVDNNQLEERARLLSQQIHLRSAFYKHNVILSPIGDDFRYIDYSEFVGVYKNWHYLKSYYDRTPEHKVKLKLGTLADYFRLIDRHVKEHEYPALSGDFYPYSDASDKYPLNSDPSNYENSPVYWTGYFTTRPYLKVALRRLETLLRQTEILYSLQKLRSADGGSAIAIPTANLSQARETLSWLLHHDAITGTSPEHTIYDFMKHLVNATSNLEQFSVQVMQQLSQTGGETKKQEADSVSEEIVLHSSPHVLTIGEDDGGSDGTAHKALLIGADDERTITLFNSLIHEVKTVAHIQLQVPKQLTAFQLSDVSTGSDVACQINPFFNSVLQETSEEFVELAFEVILPSLGFKSLKLTTSSSGGVNCQLSSVDVFVDPKWLSKVSSLPARHGFIINPHVKPDTLLTCSTKLNSVGVSAVDGSLRSLGGSHKEAALPVSQKFGLYNNGSRDHNVENGVYIFTTKNEGSTMTNDDNMPVIIISGQVETIVMSKIDFITQLLRINNVDLGVSLTQHVNNSDMVGDLFTRIGSQVKNKDRFYTDMNSFTMAERRRHYPERPIASNYYPMTSSVYVDDPHQRLTLLSAQPLGVTSLFEGQLEVMLDRQYTSFDHAGVRDGFADEKPVTLQFRLLSEKHKTGATEHLPALSTAAVHHSLKLTYPVSVYTGVKTPTDLQPFGQLPCDHHLVNLRSLDTLPYGKTKESDEDSLALILQKFSTIQTSTGLNSMICAAEDEAKWNIPAKYVVEKMSLSLLHSQGRIESKNIALVKPNSLQTYRIFKNS